MVCFGFPKTVKHIQRIKDEIKCNKTLYFLNRNIEVYIVKKFIQKFLYVILAIFRGKFNKNKKLLLLNYLIYFNGVCFYLKIKIEQIKYHIQNFHFFEIFFQKMRFTF